MASEIGVTPEQLRDAARTFESKQEEMESVVSELSNLCDSLDSWTGKAKDKFDPLSDELLKSLTDAISQILPGIKDILNSTADALEDVDAQIAAQLG